MTTVYDLDLAPPFWKRVRFAMRRLVADGPFDRAYDDCFEWQDGAWVVAGLYELAERVAFLGDALERGLGGRIPHHWPTMAAQLRARCKDLEVGAADERRVRASIIGSTEYVLLSDGPAIQGLIPGVMPFNATQAALAREAAARAKRRRSAPLQAGGHFDETARKQGDLFA
jgi:hypothetical protein